MKKTKNRDLNDIDNFILITCCPLKNDVFIAKQNTDKMRGTDFCFYTCAKTMEFGCSMFDSLDQYRTVQVKRDELQVFKCLSSQTFNFMTPLFYQWCHLVIQVSLFISYLRSVITIISHGLFYKCKMALNMMLTLNSSLVGTELWHCIT